MNTTILYNDNATIGQRILIQDENLKNEFENILKKHNRIPMEYYKFLDELLYTKLSYKPWVIIAFKDEFVLYEHIRNLIEIHKDFSFANYSNQNGIDIFYPKISLFFFKSKECLKNTVLDSPVFSTAWYELKNNSSDNNWFCIPCSPSIDWLQNQEKLENRLYEYKKTLYKEIKSKCDELKKEINNTVSYRRKEDKPLKVRCFICGKETSYDLFTDDGLPRLCLFCHRQKSLEILDFNYNDEINIAFRDNVNYKLDHPEDFE